MKIKLLLVLAVFSLACNDGGPAQPSPVTPTVARVELFATANIVTYQFTVRESAGAQASINWLRIYCAPGFGNGNPFYELSSAWFINTLGTNQAKGGELRGELNIWTACGAPTFDGSPTYGHYGGKSELNYSDSSGQHVISVQ